MAIEITIGLNENLIPVPDTYGNYRDERVRTFVVKKVTGVHPEDERSIRVIQGLRGTD